MDARSDQVLSLHASLAKLEASDEVGYKIVMFRFFVGASMEEIAEMLQVPLRSVKRKWNFLRRWLATET